MRLHDTKAYYLLHNSCIRWSYYSGRRANRGECSNRGSTVFGSLYFPVQEALCLHHFPFLPSNTVTTVNFPLFSKSPKRKHYTYLRLEPSIAKTYSSKLKIMIRNCNHVFLDCNEVIIVVALIKLLLIVKLNQYNCIMHVMNMRLKRLISVAHQNFLQVSSTQSIVCQDIL